MKKLYVEIASLCQARKNCIAKGNIAWQTNHTDKLREIAKELLPSGSGFDCGTEIDLDASNGERVIFTTSFHHMDDQGGYCGWTEHTVTMKASLQFGFTLDISGRNRNDIKDYMHEVFRTALDAEYVPA